MAQRTSRRAFGGRAQNHHLGDQPTGKTARQILQARWPRSPELCRYATGRTSAARSGWFGQNKFGAAKDICSGAESERRSSAKEEPNTREERQEEVTFGFGWVGRRRANYLLATSSIHQTKL